MNNESENKAYKKASHQENGPSVVNSSRVSLKSSRVLTRQLSDKSSNSSFKQNQMVLASSYLINNIEQLKPSKLFHGFEYKIRPYFPYSKIAVFDITNKYLESLRLAK